MDDALPGFVDDFESEAAAKYKESNTAEPATNAFFRAEPVVVDSSSGVDKYAVYVTLYGPYESEIGDFVLQDVSLQSEDCVGGCGTE